MTWKDCRAVQKKCVSKSDVWLAVRMAVIFLNSEVRNQKVFIIKKLVINDMVVRI
jgi:hypothetical protein